MARKTFPLNAWYVAAWDYEVGRSLLARQICGKKMVLFRTLAGQAVALADACWHKPVPLSETGKLIGDNVQCGYHGLRYNTQGRCVVMPSQQTLNPSACVASFPIVDAHRFVWVWPGDPTLADAALIPDIQWMMGAERLPDDTEKIWAGAGGTNWIACDYRFTLDNIMDPSHTAYAHSDSIGAEHTSTAENVMTQNESSCTLTRWMIDVEAPPFWKAHYLAAGFKPGNVDRWQIAHFLAPSVVAFENGVATTGTGAPQGDRSQGVGSRVVNCVTPITEDTCAYYWCNMRNWAQSDQGLTFRIRESLRRIISEDHVLLEAQQRGTRDFPEQRLNNLNVDVGGLWVRKIIESMIDREQSAPLASRSHSTHGSVAST
jgi:vanillate O-demethylase monooxygenase subunit